MQESYTTLVTSNTFRKYLSVSLSTEKSNLQIFHKHFVQIMHRNMYDISLDLEIIGCTAS